MDIIVIMMLIIPSVESHFLRYHKMKNGFIIRYVKMDMQMKTTSRLKQFLKPGFYPHHLKYSCGCLSLLKSTP